MALEKQDDCNQLFIFTRNFQFQFLKLTSPFVMIEVQGTQKKMPWDGYKFLLRFRTIIRIQVIQIIA